MYVCNPRYNGDCTNGGKGYANPSAAYGNGQTGQCWKVRALFAWRFLCFLFAPAHSLSRHAPPQVSDFAEGNTAQNFINSFFGSQLVYYAPTTADATQQCWTPAWSSASTLAFSTLALVAVAFVALF
jgi:hypothetical protein